MMQEILEAHNTYRAAVHVPPLSWSPTLARHAQGGPLTWRLAEASCSIVKRALITTPFEPLLMLVAED